MFIPKTKKRSKSVTSQQLNHAAIESLETRKLLTATWTTLAHTAPGGIEAMTLLSNGTVLGQINGSAGWALLTPDSTGSYVNGTWSLLSNAPDTRTYYSTQVLENGNVYIAGGEYGTGGAIGTIYNPVNNSWTPIPSGVGSYIDAGSEILNNGNVLEAPVYPATSGYTYIYNPTTNTWATGPKLYRGSDADEQNWVKLANGDILSPDGAYTSERYVAATNTWINDATSTVKFNDSLGEFGTGVLLPNGKVFVAGTGNTTDIYTPSGYNSSTGIYSPSGNTAGTWTAGPTFNSSLGEDDAPSAVLPDGNVLFTVGPIDSYSSGVTFYIYNYLTNTISTSTGAPTLTDPPYVNRFLDLPDGTTLMSIDGSTLYDYNDGGTTLTAPTPTISSIVHNTDGTYTLTGTQLTGNSEGAYYGDDAQMNSNYPIVRLTNSTTGTVYFARTYNWSTTNVDTGTLPVTTNFTLPLGLPAGTYTANVMVNGFISAGSSITTPAIAGSTAPTVATAAAATAVGGGVSTTLSVLGADDGGESNLTYMWKNTSAPSGKSTASFSINGTNASKTTTATFQQAGSYVFQVTITDSSGLSVTSSVTVVVGQVLTSVAVTPTPANLTAGQTQQLTATGYDQFGIAMTSKPTFTWTLTSGGGTVSTAGLYTSPGTGTLAVVTATTGSLSATAQIYVVSSPWISTDIGSPGVAGSAFDTGGTFNVSGSGLDVWNTADHFHYVYRTISGDGEITVRVASEPTQTTGWEKAGVMIRSTLDTASQQADISVTPGNGIAFQYRNVSGGTTANVNSGSQTAPYWVKIVRSGNLFTGYYSSNGTTWTAEGSATIVMGSSAYIGMFLTSQSDTVADTVTFDNVGVLAAGPDSISTTAGSTTSINVLTNDVGPTGSTLSVTGVTQGSKGTVTFNSSGGVTYVASSTAGGVDTFTYTMSDGLGDTATGIVTVTIQGLQAHYLFSEGTGTTSADATGDGYTATLSGATWGTGTGLDGTNALVLSGTSQYASIPALNLNSNTVTLSAWIKRGSAEPSAAGLIFERDGNNGNGLDFYSSTDLGYTWGTDASTYNFDTGLSPAIGTWTFVALVITGSGATFYMEPLGGTMTTATQSLSLSAATFSGITGLGEDPTYTTRDFAGSMDEVRIYNQSLSAAQVAAIANIAPTVATAAGASPTTVTGTTTALSVLGAGYAGESALKYTWAATTLPSGATAPAFSVNGTNASKATTATFSKAGAYVFTVTITDTDGLTTTSTVSVTVTSTLTSIAVTPTTASLASHATQQFTASAKDQFGVAMSPQPTITFTSTGSGSVTAAGLYTASYAGGSATVTATGSGMTATATVAITNGTPTVATAASAAPASVTGTTVALSVLGADDAGESNLLYTWATVGTPPAGVTFSANGTNASKATTATFTKAGNYTLQATLTDAGGASTTSSVAVVVSQTLTSIIVSPATTNLHENGTQTFTATGYDQFSNALTAQPAFNWSRTGVGTIGSSTGVYTAPATTGTATIVATSGSINSSSASVTVNNAAPMIATAASASPSPVTGTTTTLSVLGSDDGGESNLTYNWTATTVPAGAALPTYSSNGLNASKTTTATFTKAGTYTFTVTATDAQSSTASSSVNVTVSQTLTAIVVTPATSSVNQNSQQTFAAVANDQFGNSLSAQPAFTWTATGGGAVTSAGIYTAPAATGSGTVKATSSSIFGTASITVTYAGPSIATAAAASPSPATGTTTALSVLGSEPAGESNLTYTWSATTVPAGAAQPTYSINGTNAAKSTTATFSAAGSYTFKVVVTDTLGNGTTSSSVTVIVNSTLTAVTLSKSTVSAGGTAQATGIDQFGNAVTTNPGWSLNGGGSINSTGLFTAGSTGGSYSISATISSTVVSTTVVVVPTSYNGTTGSDTYSIRVSPTDSTLEQIFVNTPESGSPTYTIPTSQLTSLSFSPASDGSLTIDFSNGNPLPASGITYHGGSSLFIDGASAGGLAFTMNASQITDTAASSSPISYSSLQTVEFDLTGGANTLTQQAQPAAVVTYNAGPGNNALTINAGSYTFSNDPQLGSGNLTVNDNAAVVFSAAPSGGGYAARNLAALKLGTNATATLAASTTQTDRTVLETNSLTLASGATLDIANNAMIVHGGDIGTITTLIKSAYTNSSWTGSGITSSTAKADTSFLTTIGSLSNNNNGTAYFSTFDQQTALATDILIKQTYYGDTTLDGKVDATDYSRVDNGFLTQETGWFNGDLNYDGTVNGSDYTLMDNAFNTQGNQLPKPPAQSTIVQTAYYKFNDGISTTAMDSSGNGHTATDHNTTVVNGVDGTAGLSLNGTTSYVSLPALNLNSNTVTLSGWVERNGSQTNGAGLIFNRTSTTGNGLSIGAGNKLAYSWGTSGATYNFNSNLVIPDGQWTFVAVVVTAKNATLYMLPQGGVVSSATNNVTNPVESFSTATDIGQDTQGGKFFKGAIDEVRIYNSALTESDILTIANLAPTVAQAPTSTPSADISYQTLLQVQGASQAGAGNLTYTWTVTSAPAGSIVTFSANGTASAYSTTATGTLAGTYVYTVTISDPVHLSVTSSVSETFDVNPFDIAEVNYPPAAKGKGVQPLQLGDFYLNSRTPSDFNSNDNAADRWVLIFDSITIVGPYSQVDIGNNDMIIHSASAAIAKQTLATVTGYVDSGYGQGGASNWTYNGIVSGLAANAGAGRSAITVMLNADANGKAIYSTFDGQKVTATDVLVKYN